MVSFWAEMHKGINLRLKPQSKTIPGKQSSLWHSYHLPSLLQMQSNQQLGDGGQKSNGGGAVVSALGINGAELSYWNRWNEGWQQNLKSISPELIIIAYGTNEAFNDNIDVDKYKNLLISKVDQIRVASPDTAIMIVSAPESLKISRVNVG